MRSRIDNGTTLENRVLSTITNIQKLIAENPRCGGLARRGILFKECAQALRAIGVISSTGSACKTVYTWLDGVKPNIKLANKIAVMVRENRRKKALQNKAIDEQIPEEESKYNPFSIAKYTDQQLWDELKARQYVIKENQLCKITFLR